MRLYSPSIELASALAMLVLPTPGTSSISRWPSATMQTSDSRMASSLPEMTFATLSTTASNRSAKDVMLCAAVRCLAIGRRLVARVRFRSAAEHELGEAGDEAPALEVAVAARAEGRLAGRDVAPGTGGIREAAADE